MDANGQSEELRSAKGEGKDPPEQPSWDWTQFLPVTDYVRFLKSVDWS
jgi:hypothetical protein